MADKGSVVDMPTAESGSPGDVLSAIAVRLEGVSKVLEAEHKWFGSVVEGNRRFDDNEEDIASDIAKGWLDEEEAERKRTTDDLKVLKKQVDKHQQNLSIATTVLSDAAGTLRSILAMFHEEGGE